MRSILLWGSRSRGLRETLPQFRFVRKAVSRFMPGESIEDALGAADLLRQQGIATILTHLGENVLNNDEADRVTNHYLEVLDHIQKWKLDCHVSLKLTQLGLDLGQDIGFKNFMAIVERAASLKNFVWIDMESSSYTDVTIDMFRRARANHANVGICLQAYLRRSEEDFRNLFPLEPAIRLVKGAYAEPKPIVFQNKTEVDENLFALTSWFLRKTKGNGAMLGCATHDLRLIRRIQKDAESLGLGKTALEYQMLYGIQREAQKRLSQEGYPVRVLIAYGSYWFPWYMRRLAERPANILFLLKNLFAR